MNFGDLGDEEASCGGHGTLEILEATKLLDEAGITCCLVGVSALKYYGAWRVRHDWELCVPTENLTEASALLASADAFDSCPSRPPYMWSLRHTFPRFKVVGKSLWFILVPSDDAHIECIATNIERSGMGLPYPTLEVFAQSLLDTNNMTALEDLIDGMDLTEDWAAKFLNLDAENDVAWARRKNEKIRASVPEIEDSCLLECPVNTFNLNETWNGIVRTKERRIGWELPKEYYVTRFRGRGTGDPRATERCYV